MLSFILKVLRPCLKKSGKTGDSLDTFCAYENRTFEDRDRGWHIQISLLTVMNPFQTYCLVFFKAVPSEIVQGNSKTSVVSPLQLNKCPFSCVKQIWI